MILHIIQHSLGRDQYGQLESGKNEYRNHFYTGQGSKDWDACVTAVAQGLMSCRLCPFGGDSMIFHVTDAGRAYMLANSPKPPTPTKKTRSQQRYQRFLEYGDSFRSFIEFCRWDADPKRSWNGGTP